MKNPDNPYRWVSDTVSEILKKKEYLGHTVNFKTHKKSYKSKKKIDNPESEHMIFENTHEAIIDLDIWERVQELRKNKRRPTRTGKTNMFSGIAYCADCGQKLYYCTTKYFESCQDHFVCSTSRKKGIELCETHFIRAVILEQGVLAHMKYAIGYISQYEDKFRKIMGEMQKSEAEKELAAKRKIISKSKKRVKELDKLFKMIYEDRAKGNLSENRFKILAEDYEQEQKELNERVISLTAEIEQQEKQAR